MSKYAIQVEGLGKEYIIGGAEQRHDSFREMLSGTLTAPFRRLRKLGGTAHDEERFWALKDVSFHVEPGEVLGIIGRNGAGKSTLLKILSRITSPTEGRVVTRGRVASLLEVGTGFHPELTGRENVYLNGTILGMSRLEIARVFEEIVEFAEISKFLDTPVKRYSSGMYVRLAFSVAAHLESDILLVDEVLAVGDIAFQKKCIGKINTVATAGRTILFVSHNMAAISTLCSRCVHFQDGRVKHVGATQQIIDEYLGTELEQHPGPLAFELTKISGRGGNGLARLTQIAFSQKADNTASRCLLTGKPLSITCNYDLESAAPLRNFSAALAFRDSSGRYVCRLDSELTGDSTPLSEMGGRIICEVDSLTLGPGRYSFEAGLATGGVPCDHVRDIGFVDIENGDFFGTGRVPPESQSTLLLAHKWYFDSHG